MKIALTGASGFVGSALQKHFQDVTVIGRKDTTSMIADKLQDVDVVINLAGAHFIYTSPSRVCFRHHVW